MIQPRKNEKVKSRHKRKRKRTAELCVINSSPAFRLLVDSETSEQKARLAAPNRLTHTLSTYRERSIMAAHQTELNWTELNWAVMMMTRQLSWCTMWLATRTHTRSIQQETDPVWREREREREN